MANDLKRSFELLEVLLPSYFKGTKSIFQEEMYVNKNSHPPIKNATMEALMKIPSIQAELEFFQFVHQRFEQLYQKFKI